MHTEVPYLCIQLLNLHVIFFIINYLYVLSFVIFGIGGLLFQLVHLTLRLSSWRGLGRVLEDININEGALVKSYYLFLKEEYNEGAARQYFAAECIGLQQSKNYYWCLSSEVCVISIQCATCSSRKYPYPPIARGWLEILQDGCSCYLNFSHLLPLTHEGHRRNSLAPPPPWMEYGGWRRWLKCNVGALMYKIC